VAGIKLPVRVELHADLGQANAAYRGVVAGSHRIAIAIGRKTKKPKVGTTIVLPSRTETLWHELTHAMQCERDYDGDSKKARAYYHASLAETLGVDPDDLTREALHEKVRSELRQGDKTTLDLYDSQPWEREARAVGAALAHIEIQFPVSPKTRRGAEV
jgi:hypothetical protein